MAKLDLVRDLKELYKPSAREAALVDVPPMSFLMIDGQGDPNTSQDYVAALEALYSVAYTLKFMIKKGPAAVDYGVMPLEGLWWSDDMNAFVAGRKDSWQWTSMIMQPEFVTRELFEEAVGQAAKKKTLPALSKIRLEEFAEGRAAQIMHIGPYSAEGPTIEKLHGFISEKGFERSGKHHEIYLGDPRRAAPDKLMTVIRQPIAPAAP